MNIKYKTTMTYFYQITTHISKIVIIDCLID